ncbi:MAG: hypothetical protein ACPLYD_02310 [Anaerolineae bacterium]
MGEMRGPTRGNGGRWAVVVGLAFIAALGLAVLILWPGLRPAGGSPLAAPLPLEPTARQALRAAQEAARAWQPDALPSSLSAHWQRTRGRWPTQTVWTLHFYSPSSGRLAVFLVEVGRTRMLREAFSPYPLPTFAEEQWRVDSPQAIEAWWSSGGADFLARHSDAEVTLQLKPASPTDHRPEWVMTAMAGRQVQVVTISGVDGQRRP